jgi:autotransporter translocation and assembly factor TamB
LKRRIAASLLIVVLAGATVAMKIVTSPWLDGLIQDALIRQAEIHMGVKLTLGSFDHNIFMTRYTLEEVVLSDLKGEGREIRARRVIVAFDPYATFRGVVSIKDVQLEGIDLQVIHNADGSVSVDPILPFWQGRRVEGRSRIQTLKVEFKRFTLIDSRLTFRDVPAGINLDLEKVLIGVGRDRFDPPDRRNVNITSRSGNIKWRAFPEGRSVPIDAIRVSLALDREGIDLSLVSLVTGPVQVELSGRVPLNADASVEGTVGIVADLGELSWLVAGGNGKIHLSGAIAGPLRSPAFRGKLTSGEIGLGGRSLQDLSAALEMDGSGGRLTDLHSRYRGESIRAEMDVRFTRDLPFTMEVTAQDYPVHKMIREFQKDAVKPEGEVSFTCRIEGRLSPGVKNPGADIRLVGQGAVPFTPGVTMPLEIDLGGSFADGEMALEGFNLSLGSADLSAMGKMNREGLSLQLTAMEDDLGEWGEVLSLQDMGGDLVATGQISGSWLSPEAQLDLVVKGLSGGGLRVDLIEAHADVDSSRVSFPLASLKVLSSAITLQGEFPWDSREEAWLSVGVSSARIDDFLKAAGSASDVTGEVSASMNFSRFEGRWLGTGESVLREFSLYEELFQECRMKIEVADGGLILDRIELNKAGSRVRGRAEIRDGRFKVRLATVDTLALDSLRSLKRLKVPFTGEMMVEAEGEGTIDGQELSASARLQWENISFEGRPWQGGRGSFTLKNRTLEGVAELLDGKFAARAEGQLEGDFPFSGTIRTTREIDHQDLNDFLGLGIPSDYASGKSTAEAEARGILADLDKTEVDGTLDNASFTIKGLNFTSKAPVPFQYNPERGIRFQNLRLRSGGSDLQGFLVIARRGVLEGTIEGGIDLGGFSFLEPTVDSFQGGMDIQVKVSGTLSQPDLSGFLVVHESSCIAHLPFPLEIKGLAGRVEVVKDRLHFQSLAGRVENGSIVMTGDIFFRGITPSQGHLEWRGESVPVRFPEGLWTLNRGHLTMRFSEGKGDIRGTIQMDEGKYTRQIDLDNLVSIIGEGSRFSRADDDSSVTGAGRGDWLSLDIEMRTANPLDVDIKLVRGQARGALRLQGTADRPLLSGRLEMDEGVILYRGRSFEITQGSVGFFNPRAIEPNFDFSSKALVSGFDRDGVLTEFDVELHSSGVPGKFNLDLSSSPTLSEVDIISLLTWGAVGEQAFSEGGGISATEATLILTQKLRGQLESEVQQITGFDRFVIDPAFVTSSGERVPRIRIDKRLSDRLSLSARTPILSDEESEFLIRYRISDLLSVIGEQAGEQEFGLDLDFKFEIR